jgi:L-glyceraldehyde 3-phosphate reductase
MEFSAQRYDRMQYRRCGKSGLKLPAVSLGAWQAIGSYRDEKQSREIFFRAFDLGITHFDFANNYGDPPGTSERLFSHIVKEMPRDELIISTKAGYEMWPGPYGEWGSRKNLIASCDASLKRLGLEYVDIFYSHRVDPDTPIDETMGALETIVRQGKALYAGVSSYFDKNFQSAIDCMRRHDWAPILINQPAYHLLDRKPERGILPIAEDNGVGVIAFCPLAQGLLTDRYLNGIPPDSRAAQRVPYLKDRLTPQFIAGLQKLDALAKRRSQSLAQLSLAWLLKDPRLTSVLIGASSTKQVEDNVRCLDHLDFSQEELDEIDVICQSMA